jgi:hypothetical protein
LCTLACGELSIDQSGCGKMSDPSGLPDLHDNGKSFDDAHEDIGVEREE